MLTLTAQTEQPDLFRTIHELVREKGAREAVQYAQAAAALQHPGEDSLAPFVKVLAGRNGRRIVDAASASIVRETECSQEIGYSYSAWCLAGLPHRDHPPGADWLIETDFAQLLVRPGVRVADDGTREKLAVPTGTLARLLLIDWQTEAYEHDSRTVVMGPNPNALLRRLGLSRGGPVSRKVADQLERLSRCTVDFKFGNDREGVIVNERLVEAFHYVTEDDPRTKRPTRMIERVTLSEAFYRELRRHPVPVDRAAIKEIQTSPRAIDVYLWLAFRLHALERETPVSWAALWRQFGREKTLRSFKDEFKEPLALALSVYQSARVGVADRGVILAPSPPPVLRAAA
jgi:hypothetical protein